MKKILLKKYSYSGMAVIVFVCGWIVSSYYTNIMFLLSSPEHAVYLGINKEIKSFDFNLPSGIQHVPYVELGIQEHAVPTVDRILKIQAQNLYLGKNIPWAKPNKLYLYKNSDRIIMPLHKLFPKLFGRPFIDD